jgi:hypothetical protein
LQIYALQNFNLAADQKKEAQQTTMLVSFFVVEKYKI